MPMEALTVSSMPLDQAGLVHGGRQALGQLRQLVLVGQPTRQQQELVGFGMRQHIAFTHGPCSRRATCCMS